MSSESLQAYICSIGIGGMLYAIYAIYAIYIATPHYSVLFYYYYSYGI